MTSNSDSLTFEIHLPFILNSHAHDLHFDWKKKTGSGIVHPPKIFKTHEEQKSEEMPEKSTNMVLRSKTQNFENSKNKTFNLVINFYKFLIARVDPFIPYRSVLFNYSTFSIVSREIRGQRGDRSLYFKTLHWWCTMMDSFFVAQHYLISMRTVAKVNRLRACMLNEKTQDRIHAFKKKKKKRKR